MNILKEKALLEQANRQGWSESERHGLELLFQKRERVPGELWSWVQKTMPITCVDVIVLFPGRGVILGHRAHPPAENVDWFVGGRAYRGETLEQTAMINVWKETGLEVRLIQKERVGTGDTTFYEGEDRQSHNATFAAVVVGGEPQQNKNFSRYRYVNGVEEDLHPYVKEFLARSGIFEGKFSKGIEVYFSEDKKFLKEHKRA